MFTDGRALLLTEPGTEHRAGVWVVQGEVEGQDPVAELGPEATELDAAALLAMREAATEALAAPEAPAEPALLPVEPQKLELAPVCHFSARSPSWFVAEFKRAITSSHQATATAKRSPSGLMS